MSPNRPSRSYVLKVYAKRAIRWRKNSSPYISGDAFADISDVSLFPPRFRGASPSLREIRDANLIFCPSAHLQQFLSDHKNKLSAKVIICGNDDTEFHSVPADLPKSLRRLYLQNSFISDSERIFTLPIGIENLRYGVNGHPRLMYPSRDVTPLPQILFGPFSPTHIERSQITSRLSQVAGPWKFVEGSITPKKNQNQTHQFSWVGAVRGNGIDTHRLWETIYRERTPIIKRDAWSTSLEYLRLPIKLISSWEESDLRNFVQENVHVNFSAKKLLPLWMDWWKNEFRMLMH